MKSNRVSRRGFFAGAVAAISSARALRALSFDSAAAESPANAAAESPANKDRLQAALDIRRQANQTLSSRKIGPMVANGDESAYPSRIGCFAKGLPQNSFGEVQPTAYDALLAALKSQKFSDFEAIPRGGGRKLSNPQSAFAFHLEGGDPHTFKTAPAPSIGSAEISTDVNELYWQALCRDVPFSKYVISPIVQKAAKHLGSSPENVFRGPTRGDLSGPYVSQFLLKPIPYGSGQVVQTYNVPVPGSDFMTTIPEWAQMQTGFQPWRAATYEEKPRYIRNGRDLSEYVHYDFAYQAYLGAALILVNANAKSVLNCNQFRSSNNPYRYSTVEEGFATFGPPEAIDWLGRVTTAALKTAYCQKWAVHRRVRPEALGGLIHQTRIGKRKYPISETIVHSEAVEAVAQVTGTALLPQTYPEGCPLHPSYPAGHAAVAGACSVVLKACFDGDMLFPACVEPSPDGLSLQPCSGYFPTVGDEIDKLAYNVSMGRNWAGIHFRSDNAAGLKLGEDVGISILQDLALTFPEQFKGFRFKRFDGSRVYITPKGQLLTG